MKIKIISIVLAVVLVLFILLQVASIINFIFSNLVFLAILGGLIYSIVRYRFWKKFISLIYNKRN